MTTTEVARSYTITLERQDLLDIIWGLGGYGAHLKNTGSIDDGERLLSVARKIASQFPDE